MTVVPDGFVWQDTTYSSLTTIARAITGTVWNGPRFFGLRFPDKPDAVQTPIAPLPQSTKPSKRSRSSVRVSGATDVERGTNNG